ncbi:hypothetical protein [Paenibacillus hamazuiensis]|uniref:hypothetical protein n=1 Tax=Paenibacillus hamazuiensis TaxID=2936508 RepID=UPI00200DAD96|nr:hypothetical protein [Paenibacillus hamazuiensis]
MYKPYSRKLIVSTLALAILLGGSLAYGAGGRALAENQTQNDQQQTQSGDKQSKLKEFKQRLANRQAGQKRDEERFPIVEEAAAILGMDKEALTEALKEKSLADIAKEKGITESDLVAKLQTERSNKIDEAVASGKITADKAAKLKESMSKHLSFMVNKKGLHLLGKSQALKEHPMMKESLGKVAELLGMSKEDLSSELKAGKSLAEIAEAKGISKDQLVAKIKEQMTPMIEKMVDHKREAKSSAQN